MMRAGIIITVLASAILFSGCKDNNSGFKETFMALEGEPQLEQKGTVLLAYDSDDYQLGYNASKYEFRVMDDNMANYFILTCDRRPVVGESLNADLIYTTSNNVKTVRGLSFSVEKSDDQGHVWLWNSKSGYAVIVKIVE